MTRTADETHEPRWRRTPEERPRQIIEAALLEFGERGLAGARLDDIAKRAGVAKGTIYLYFPNKEELFREVVRQTVVLRLERAETEHAPDPALRATGQLRDYLRAWWAYLSTPPFQTVYRLVISELHRFPELAEFYHRDVVQRAHRLVGALVSHGVATGEFRPVDPAVTARIAASMFVTHGLWAAKRQLVPGLHAIDDAQVFDQLCDFFFSALRPSDDAARDAHRVTTR